MTSISEIQDELSSIVGSDHVYHKDHDLTAYTRDISPYRPLWPDVVALPGNKEEVSKILSFANKNKIPVTCRAGGTTIKGNCIPRNGGIVLDLARMDQVLEINEEMMTITVQAGCPVFKAEKAAGKKGWRLPLRTMFASGVTAGAWTSTNGFGLRNSKYGRTIEFTQGVEVVLPTGEIIRTGANAFKNSGPFTRYAGIDVTSLFSGAAGTMGVMTEVTWRIVPIFEGFDCITFGFDDPKGIVIAATELQRRELISTYDIEDDDCYKVFLGIDFPDRLVFSIDVENDKEVVPYQMKEARKICEEAGGIDRGSSISKFFWDEIVTVSFASSSLGRFLCVDCLNTIQSFPEVFKIAKDTFAKYNLANGWLGVGIVPNYQITAPTGFYTEPDQWDDCLKAYEEIYEGWMKVPNVVHSYPSPIFNHFFHEGMRPEEYEFLKRIKHLVDPNNIMNPGLLPY